MSTEIPAPATPITEIVHSEGAKPDEPLGEPGLAALKSEREARKAAEKSATDALAKVKEFENRDKSDEQKRSEEADELRRENAELKSAKTRAEVAATKGVPANLLSGSTQEELEASADALIAFKGDEKPQKLIIPNEGRGTTAADTNAATAFAQWTADQNF